jgi:hypothetical protein
MVQLKELKDLDLKDRFFLWNGLWESIINDVDMPVSDYEKEILDQRYERYQQNPDQGRAWDKIYKDLKSSQ